MNDGFCLPNTKGKYHRVKLDKIVLWIGRYFNWNIPYFKFIGSTWLVIEILHFEFSPISYTNPIS